MHIPEMLGEISAAVIAFPQSQKFLGGLIDSRNSSAGILQHNARWNDVKNSPEHFFALLKRKIEKDAGSDIAKDNERAFYGPVGQYRHCRYDGMDSMASFVNEFALVRGDDVALENRLNEGCARLIRNDRVDGMAHDF